MFRQIAFPFLFSPFSDLAPRCSSFWLYGCSYFPKKHVCTEWDVAMFRLERANLKNYQMEARRKELDLTHAKSVADSSTHLQSSKAERPHGPMSLKYTLNSYHSFSKSLLNSHPFLSNSILNPHKFHDNHIKIVMVCVAAYGQPDLRIILVHLANRGAWLTSQCCIWT